MLQLVAPPLDYLEVKLYDAHLHFSHHHLTNHGIVSSEAETITQHWSRDNLLATSYDVNLTTFAPTNNNNHIPTRGIHSRENTLSRDIHHITVSIFLLMYVFAAISTLPSTVLPILEFLKWHWQHCKMMT